MIVCEGTCLQEHTGPGAGSRAPEDVLGTQPGSLQSSGHSSGPGWRARTTQLTLILLILEEPKVPTLTFVFCLFVFF